jgi:hypothetical protein
MTLYEEAGIPREATSEEIRCAYHNYVRLLHPDTVRDVALQRAAEAQMRRINAIFEVLTDPRRKRAYDLSLEGTAIAPLVTYSAPHATGRSASSQVLAGVAIVATFALMMWLAMKPASRQPVRLEPKPPMGPYEPLARRVAVSTVPSLARGPGSDVIADELRRLREELREVRSERNQPPGEPRSIETVTPVVPDQSAPSLPKFDTAAGPNVPAPIFTGAGAASSDTPALTGTWLYAQKPAVTPKKDWYPPEFIELRVDPSSSGIAGRYQARYRVGDRPISPEVRFRFEGKGDVLPWVGPNGSRGELRLKRLSPLTLQVDWVTTQDGGIPSLMSGSSVLVKSQAQ